MAAPDVGGHALLGKGKNDLFERRLTYTYRTGGDIVCKLCKLLAEFGLVGVFDGHIGRSESDANALHIVFGKCIYAN